MPPSLPPPSPAASAGGEAEGGRGRESDQSSARRSTSSRSTSSSDSRWPSDGHRWNCGNQLHHNVVFGATPRPFVAACTGQFEPSRGTAEGDHQRPPRSRRRRRSRAGCRASAIRPPSRKPIAGIAALDRFEHAEHARLHRGRGQLLHRADHGHPLHAVAGAAERGGRAGDGERRAPRPCPGSRRRSPSVLKKRSTGSEARRMVAKTTLPEDHADAPAGEQQRRSRVSPAPSVSLA